MTTAGPTDPPLVSVVVPTYDRPALLAEAVTSVLDQTYPHIELLVIDDASPTPIEPTVERVVGDSLTWDCIRHSENHGANVARTTGIERSSGEIIAFLDDDDRWAPEKLGVQVAAFGLPPRETGVVLVGQQFVDDDGTVTHRKHPQLTGNALEQLLCGATAGPFSAIVVTRSAIAQAGPPDPALPSLQDREWLVRLAQHVPFRSITDEFVLRRTGAYEQIGDQYVEKRDRSYPHFKRQHRHVAREHGLDGQFSSWLAASVSASALRSGAYGDAVRYAGRSIRAHPRNRIAWWCLLAGIGGPVTYGLAKHVNRTLARQEH